jgi:hypothetical protein
MEKPHEEIFREAKRLSHVQECSELLHVGDHPVKDFIGAQVNESLCKISISISILTSLFLSSTRCLLLIRIDVRKLDESGMM